jgi:transposase-like protein
LWSRTPLTFGCKGCGKETSVTAGTIMHRTHLPLGVWFWAACLVATHSNGMSAKQLQKQLGLGSYKSAWLLCGKLRRAMVAPDRSALSGLVEIDETVIPFRRKADPPHGGQGRSAAGKMRVLAAVEVNDGRPGRLRLAPIADFSAASLHAFVKANVEAGATARTDGWSAYAGTPGVNQDACVVGPMAAHIVLPWTHRVFANLKTWALGVYHGLRRKHLQAYLNEFVFRFNRRRTRHAAFRTLLGIAAATKPATYNMLIQPEAQV